MNTCIDLRERFGHKYRIVSEDGTRRNTDAWLWQVICANGHLYPHGGDRLGAATNRRGPLIGKLLAVPSARLEQLGDDGANVSFDVSDFRAMAAIMRPRRRRQLTPEQRAKMAAIGREALQRHRTNVQNAQNGAVGTFSGHGDQGADQWSPRPCTHKSNVRRGRP
jgi:hypothetical protein